MKKTILIIMLFAFVMCAFSQDAFAGAWTVKKYKVWAEWYTKWSWAKGNEGFNDEGQRTDSTKNARSWGWTMEPKLEYGVTDWFNLLFSMEYKESKYKEYDRPPSWGDFRRKNNGVTFVKFGGKLRFIEKPFVLSGQMKVYLYPGYGNNHGDDPVYRNQPSIGDGEDVVEFKALIGKEFKAPFSFLDKPLKCYAAGEFGYRFKNRTAANDIPVFVEGGFWPFSWLLLKAELDTIISHEATGSMKKSYSIWRVGPVWQILAGDSVTKKGKQFNVEVQYGHTYWGKNTNKEQEIVLKCQTEF